MFKRVLFIASLLCVISFSVKAVSLTAHIRTVVSGTYCTYTVFNFQDSSAYVGTHKGSLKDNWYYSDGTTDTGISVTKYFTATGTYTIKLVVSDAADGLKDSTTKSVTITGTGILPKLSWTGATCERSEMTFSITSGFTNVGYTTDFGDASSPVTTPPGYSSSNPTPGIHVYQTRGSYKIIVNDVTSAGCKSQITVPITILQRPFARDASPPTASQHCQDSSITFKAVQQSASDTQGMRVTYLWEFQEDKTNYTGKTVTKLFKDSGIFHFKLVLINHSGIGCSDSTGIIGFQVYSNPIVNFNMVPHCQDSIAKIYDNSSTKFSNSGLYSWHWMFCDSNHSNCDTAAGYTGRYSPDSFYYGFPHGGTFYITEYVKSLEGCSDSLQKKVYINPTPTPNFGFHNACLDSALQFMDSSTVPKGNTVVAWNWNFGDKGTSLLQNPSHKYMAPSYNYSVRLIAKTQAGCIDSVRKNAIVYPLPLDSFSFISKCQGAQLLFFNNASMSNPALINGDSITGYYWNFGDGATNNGSPTPTHAFKDSGYHKVLFSAFSKHGCSDTVSQRVYVYPLPRPSFKLGGGFDCERDSIQFINTSTVGYGVLNDTSYSWDFGDTSFADIITNPTHLYHYSDTFQVKLTAITSRNQCTKDTTIPVIIIPGPHSSFTVGPKCTGAPVQFTNTTYSKHGGIIKYVWHFGDGTTDTSKNPSHTYPGTGNYRVWLTSDMPSTGCKDSTSLSYVNSFVSITPRPIVFFRANNACADSDVICVDSSYVPGYTRPIGLQSITWDFGDGYFGSDTVVRHRYAAPGVYTIREYVTSKSDCEDSFIRKVTIYKVPVSNFSFVESCAGTPTPFTSLTKPSDSVATWEWFFSDNTGDTITSQNTSHVYQDNDILDATLTVLTANGCPNTKTEGVSIYLSPVATFAYNKNCDQDSVPFYAQPNSVIQPPNTIAAYHWDFGDTALADRPFDSSASQTPKHVFEYAGNYNVVLTETSSQGCVTIDTQVVIVPLKPVAGFTYSGNCVGRTFVFADTSKPLPPPPATSVANWDFGDGNNATGTPGYDKYAKPGTYIVKLYEQATYPQYSPLVTCISDTAYATVVVNPRPYARFYTDTACFGHPTTFIDSSKANGGHIASYSWIFGDGGSDTIFKQQFYHTYKDSFPGNDSTYRAILKISTNYGCDSSDTQKVFIRQIPYTSFSANPDPVDIQTSQVTFTNTTLHADPNHYYWTFGDGTDSHDISPIHTYKDTGTYEVVLSADNDYCPDTFRYIVYVTPGYTLYAPNCITVNGDGKNDVWFAKGVGVVDFDVVIVDRWGQMVFHSQDINQPWNADYNGNGVKVPEGAYVFYIKAGDFSQTNFRTLKGNITVVR